MGAILYALPIKRGASDEMQYTSDLTKRECEVVETIINKKCFTVKQIATAMVVTPDTVAKHLENIYAKKTLHNNSIAGIIWDYYNGDLKDD